MEIKLYTIEETAEMLGITTRTLQTYIKKGLIRAKKIGKRWRFTEQSINAYVYGNDDQNAEKQAQDQGKI